MRLLQTPTSPFARKVRVVLRETGLLDRVEEVDLSGRGLTPTSPLEDVNAANPLGKIPALLLDEGALFDSRVIVEYLDSLAAPSERVLPVDGAARWTALRLQALADGIADAAVLVRYERALRPEAHQWSTFLEGQLDKIRRAVDAVEAEGPPEGVDLGALALAVTLEYVDFRLGDDDLWRSRCPKLVAWHGAIAQRASLADTPPA